MQGSRLLAAQPGVLITRDERMEARQESLAQKTASTRPGSEPGPGLGAPQGFSSSGVYVLSFTNFSATPFMQ